MRTCHGRVGAGIGLFVGAGRRAPVRKAGVAVALCAAGGAVLAAAALIRVAKTGGETWLMPVFVYPALLLLTAVSIVIGAVVRRAEPVPRWMAIALIVGASLLPLYQPQTPGNFTPRPTGTGVSDTRGAARGAKGGQTGSHLGEPRPRAVV